MRQCGILLTKLFLKREEGFLRFPLPCDDPECPIADFLSTGKPFVRPGKKNRAGKTAFHHAIDMPAEHFSLLVLRMPDRIQAEFAKDQRTLFRQILQTQQVAFEIALIVQVNIETGKIDVLRQEIFGRWISGVGKKNIRIHATSDPNQFLYEFCDAACPEPTHHRARNFIADEVTE